MLSFLFSANRKELAPVPPTFIGQVG
jgi:hypothetical protein